MAGSLDNLEGKKGYWFIATGAFDFTYIAPDPSSARVLEQNLLEVPSEFSYHQSMKHL